MDDHDLTVEEATGLLSVSRVQVVRWVEAGDMSLTERGLIRRDDIRAIQRKLEALAGFAEATESIEGLARHERYRDAMHRLDEAVGAAAKHMKIETDARDYDDAETVLRETGGGSQ